MKSKLSLISSIIQLIFGMLAIVAFIILLINGEDISKWNNIITRSSICNYRYYWNY